MDIVHSSRMSEGHKTTCKLDSVPVGDSVSVHDNEITCMKCYCIIKESYKDRKKFTKSF